MNMNLENNLGSHCKTRQYFRKNVSYKLGDVELSMGYFLALYRLYFLYVVIFVIKKIQEALLQIPK